MDALITVESLKGYVYNARPDMRTVICFFDTRNHASAGFLALFKERLQARFGPYYTQIQFFTIDLATDPDGMDGLNITKPESAHIPAIWTIQGGLWNLNDPAYRLEKIALGPFTGQCFDTLSADISSYLWPDLNQ